MKATDIPAKISLAWGSSAGPSFLRTVPVPSQQGVQAGAASWTDGFPPTCFTPVAAGGTPPFGADFNGALNALSALLKWYSAGGTVSYDPTFQTAVGGYPKGAIVQSAATPGVFWTSTADNNVSNPDAGGAGWTSAYSPPAGTVLPYAGNTLPVGYLFVPTAPTLVSTTTYSALFAALNYSWGGSGASFGIPYLPSGYTPVQGSLAALTHGAILSHTHGYASLIGFSAGGNNFTLGGAQSFGSGTVNAAGGADNLAAGLGHQFIVKF